jgi:hypothetical protein
MIKTFADRHTLELYETGKSSRFPPDIRGRAIRRLEYIDHATGLEDLILQTARVLPVLLRQTRRPVGGIRPGAGDPPRPPPASRLRAPQDPAAGIPTSAKASPKLALCVWKALSSFLREDTGGGALPAAIVSIQTAGEFLNWHPTGHIRMLIAESRDSARFSSESRRGTNRPGAGLSPSTPSVSTSDVCMDFGLMPVPW